MNKMISVFILLVFMTNNVMATITNDIVVPAQIIGISAGVPLNTHGSNIEDTQEITRFTVNFDSGLDTPALPITIDGQFVGNMPRQSNSSNFMGMMLNKRATSYRICADENNTIALGTSVQYNGNYWTLMSDLGNDYSLKNMSTSVTFTTSKINITSQNTNIVQTWCLNYTTGAGNISVKPINTSNKNNIKDYVFEEMVKYDINNDKLIQKSEATSAVIDYINGTQERYVANMMVYAYFQQNVISEYIKN